MLEQLNEREKRLLFIAAICLPIFFLFYLGQFIYKLQQSSVENVKIAEQQLSQVRKLKQNLNSTKPVNKIELDQAGFLRVVNKQITRNKLNPSSINEKKTTKKKIETYEIIIKFYKVDMLKFMNFLYDIEHDQVPLEISLLSINRKISKNQIYDVNLKISFEREAKK